jgi:hypothetical protein
MFHKGIVVKASAWSLELEADNALYAWESCAIENDQLD